MRAITDLFEESVKKYNNNVFLWQKISDRYEPFTYSETHEKVYLFAAGLLSLGIQKKDRVALLSEGCNNWVIGELGILYTGATNVPLSVKLNEHEIRFRLEHSGARFILVSKSQINKLNLENKDSEYVGRVILMDSETLAGKDIVSFDSVMDLGRAYLKKNSGLFYERWKSVKPEDYANICYTSGTTADPKGVILTHQNYTSNADQSLTLMDIPSHYVSLMILPLDHAFAHTVGIYVLMKCGASMATVQVGKSPLETLKNIPINIKEAKPHFLLSVPALAKNFKKNIENGIRTKGPFVRLLFLFGIKTGHLYNGIGINKGKGFRIFLKPLVLLFDKLIFFKVRENFGGRLEFFIGGGAMLDMELQKFFFAIGIPMYQGYGLSESSPVISSNAPPRFKMGTSGVLVKPLELKIVDNQFKEVSTGEKGEIIVKGSNVMAGYWNNPGATEAAIKDKWLYTGDLGTMDKDGFLNVYGRFKSLLIADDGEKYSPENMEETFASQSPFIDQCLLYNNQNPYTVALIVPNKEALRSWWRKHKHHHPMEEGVMIVLKLIESELTEYRTGKRHGTLFPQRWLPAAIGILQEGFTEDNGLMNSTMKIVRVKVTERYKDLVTFLYTPEGKNVTNKINQESIKNQGILDS